MRNRSVTARETTSNVPDLRRISVQTVKNRLRENGLRARRPYFGAVLGRRHRLARARWCNKVRDWDLQNRRRVWFSDIHAVEKRWPYTCLQTPELEVDNFGGGSAMMWGAISYAEKLNIHGNLNAARHRDEVLTPHMLARNGPP